ncbi:MAG: right-handed parallel beta-helix repeat-containing protein [Planctomycetaceae bacterium]|jgi:hypothetical protein|nr:right-handed parallel beta-helix repeat-containing protein [Planctomycetaceae bacterium]
MRVIFKFTLVVLFFVYFYGCPMIYGRDIFVNSSLGDDKNSGLSEQSSGAQDGPVQTIKQGLKLVRRGDRLVLDPTKPYKESITLSGKNVSGQSSDLSFIIEGRGAVLDGMESLPIDVWEFYKDEIFRFRLTLPNVDVTYFHILQGGKPLKRIKVAAGAVKLPRLEASSWCIFRGYVYFRAETGRSPMIVGDYDLSYSERRSGISVIQATNIKIHDLTIQGYQIDGISAVNGATNIVLDNVTCSMNGRSGLAIGGASFVAAGYCKFEDNLSTQILLLNYARYILHQCNLPKNGITKSK